MLGCNAEVKQQKGQLMFDAEQRWKKLWETRDVPSPRALLAYGRLRQAYGSSNRLYHNMGHIRHCLNVFDAARNLTLYPDEVETAIWLHDVCYNVFSSCNEEDSVAWAQGMMKEFNVSDAFVKKVSGLIMATKKHDGQLTDPDEQLVADIDLSSLGVDWDAFWINTKDIEREYHHVDRATFARERVKILQRFLDRALIYYTPELRVQYEKQARRNLTRSITMLRERVAV